MLYRLRAIVMGVHTDGLVKANEEFAAWLASERSMPLGAAARTGSERGSRTCANAPGRRLAGTTDEG